MKLLIVDDANVIRRQIRRMVEQTNGCALQYEIETAVNGVDAMQKFDAFAPTIVTLDVTMPEMDGLACVTQMLRRSPATRILVISALADRATAVEAVKRGAKGFLLKPFSAETLADEIDELLREPRRKKQP